jgi:hypothetical protein
MKLPPPHLRHKVKRGQVWRKNRKTPAGEYLYVLITATRGNDWVHTVSTINRKNAHRMNIRDLWRFYTLVEKRKNKQSHNNQ